MLCTQQPYWWLGFILSFRCISGACPTSYTDVLGDCYHASGVGVKMTLTLADSYCQELSGGQLISIHSETQNDAVHSALVNNERTWVGLRKVNSSWGWLDGTPLDYSSYGDGEPGDKEECLYWKDDRKWYDDKCTSEHRALCALVPGACPTSYTDVLGDCYHASGVGVKMTLTLADSYCQGLSGGQLISIHSETQSDAVHSAFVNNEPTWVGLRKVSSAWGWLDGTQLDYTSYGDGEPEGDEECLYWKDDRKWYDVTCTSEYRALCAFVPEETTLAAQTTTSPSAIMTSPSAIITSPSAIMTSPSAIMTSTLPSTISTWPSTTSALPITTSDSQTKVPDTSPQSCPNTGHTYAPDDRSREGYYRRTEDAGVSPPEGVLPCALGCLENPLCSGFSIDPVTVECVLNIDCSSASGDMWLLLP